MGALISVGSLDFVLPKIVQYSGEDVSRRFFEFFTANIRNPNTRSSYWIAVRDFFGWCDEKGFGLHQIDPIVVSAYIENHSGHPSTIKQHLAAIKMLFDWLVVGQVLRANPASSVRGPKYVARKGKTPILDAGEARKFLNDIETSSIIGLRDRALVSVMLYSFARVSAVVGMNIVDYYPLGKRWWFRLHEKGGKFHEMPAHHLAEEYMDSYIESVGLKDKTKKDPLFQTTPHRSNKLSGKRMSRIDVIRMIKRRAKRSRINQAIGCHTFRGTGITNYLENGGTLEKAQIMAAHESSRTTKLYDRTSDQITLDEVERIKI